MATLVYLDVNETYFNNSFYERQSGTNQYEILRLKSSSITAILYNSKKLVVQGSDEALERFKQENPNLVLKKTKEKKQTTVLKMPYSEEYIGSDETLKGDTFGGLVVVAAYFKKSEEHDLKTLGVVDSKQLTDLQIQKIAKVLLEKYSEKFVVNELEPTEYNNLILTKSITHLLNDLHKQTGSELKKLHPKALHVVDQYPGCSCGDFKMPKAESFSLAVAAASIVARDYGLRQFERLSKKAGFVLPKGSTHVEQGLKLIIELHLPLRDFAKLHFKNVQKMMQLTR